MERRYTHDYVEKTYSKESIRLIGNYRNLHKNVKLECESCHYTWDELFNPDKNPCCPKCGSVTEKVDIQSEEVETEPEEVEVDVEPKQTEKKSKTSRRRSKKTNSKS